jgi:hypothetical protein
MEVHKNSETNLKYVCKICSAQYGRSFALTDHLKTAHPGMENEAIEIEEHYVIEEAQSSTVAVEDDDDEVYYGVIEEDEK